MPEGADMLARRPGQPLARAPRGEASGHDPACQGVGLRATACPALAPSPLLTASPPTRLAHQLRWRRPARAAVLVASVYRAGTRFSVPGTGLFCLMWIFVQNQQLLSHTGNEKQSSSRPPFSARPPTSFFP